MTKAGFGEHLKREREMRGVSLDEICAATRIGTRFLEALESEEWERLPGGVFNRGFVRAVARFLGLDEDGFVAEYALALNENSTPVWTNQPTKAQVKLNWIPLAGIAVILIVLVGAGWFGWHVHARHRAQRSATQQAIDTSAAPAVNATPVPVTASPITGNPSTNSPVPSAAAAGAAGNSSTTSNPAAAPSDALQLKIEAGKATTLRVSADGKRVFEGRIIAGQNRTFTARTDFNVEARDAGALLLELNGRTLAPIGPPGRPGKVTLTRHDAPASAGGFD